MENAKEELLEILGNNPTTIKCADLSYGYEEQEFKLSVVHTDLELNAFLESLDFKYNSDYGGQNLFGIVWLKDGTWLSRGEYDGSEWWKHNFLPEIPKELM